MKKRGILLIIALLLVICLFDAMYTVRENEYACTVRFSKIIETTGDSGLHFKVPFIDSVKYFSKATTLYDIPPSEVLTSDKQNMTVDCYILWRISDPLKFSQTLNGSIGNAESRINTTVYNATKNVISSMNQDEVISGRSGLLSESVMNNIGSTMDQYGIELIAFDTKQLDLPDDNKAAVYERMISERENIAATYTAEGNSEGKVIRNTTDKEIAIQISDAEKQAEILVAEGEAEYMRILSEAYADASRTEFYSFVRSLDALKESIIGDNKTIILDKNSPIAQIFYGGN